MSGDWKFYQALFKKIFYRLSWELHCSFVSHYFFRTKLQHVNRLRCDFTVKGRLMSRRCAWTHTMSDNTVKKPKRCAILIRYVCLQEADGDCNGVRTFMSVGNSSFFTRPVAATMFPIAPVVFSATAGTHKHHVHTCNIISADSAGRLKACTWR